MVALSSPHVPWEVFDAAGLEPTVLAVSRAATPDADRYLESGLFTPRIRALVQAWIEGALDDYHALVLPRTNEQDYRAFLYLRELERTGVAAGPPLLLYDLLLSDSRPVRDYGLARTRALVSDAARLAGRVVGPSDLAAAIARSNEARRVLRDISACRRSSRRCSGSAAMVLAHAFHTTPRGDFIQAVSKEVTAMDGRPIIERPRCLVAGVPVEDGRLHQALEAAGLVVVAETSAWGTDVPSVAAGGHDDPVESIYAHYAEWPASRTPLATSLARVARVSQAGVDGVVFWLPPQDSVFGWEYPTALHALAEHGIPSYVVRESTPDAHGGWRREPEFAAFLDAADARWRDTDGR